MRQLAPPTGLGSGILNALPGMPRPTGLAEEATCCTSVGTGCVAALTALEATIAEVRSERRAARRAAAGLYPWVMRRIVCRAGTPRCRPGLTDGPAFNTVVTFELEARRKRHERSDVARSHGCRDGGAP